MSGPRSSSPTRFDLGPPSSEIVVKTRDEAGMQGMQRMQGMPAPSAGLRFLLVAYVGARWEQERKQDMTQWQRGAQALRSVLEQLAQREWLTALAASRYQGQRHTQGTSPVPCISRKNDRGEGEAL